MIDYPARRAKRPTNNPRSGLRELLAKFSRGDAPLPRETVDQPAADLEAVRYRAGDVIELAGLRAPDAIQREAEIGGRAMKQDSKAFLIEMFTGLRDDLAEQAREGGKTRPDPEKAARHRAIYDTLLAGLTGREGLPDDEEVREYVTRLARAIDEENGYEEAALEHRAFAELVGALTDCAD